MNKKMLIFTFFIMFVQIIIPQNVCLAKESVIKTDKIDEIYQQSKVEEITLSEKEECLYQISPLNEEWSGLTYSEQLVECDMPEDFLEKCSTFDLAEYVLEYPFLLDIYAFNSTEQGIEHLINTSNVCREFFSRNDANEVLLQKYEVLSVNYDLLTEEIMENLENSFDQSGYDKELFLQSYFGININHLNINEKEQLKQIISEKYEQKKGKCDNFSSSLLIYDEIQQVRGDIPNEVVPDNVADELIEAYSNDGFTATSSSVFSINGASYEKGVYNKYGVSTGCYHYVSGDWTASEKAEINKVFHSSHPAWTMVYSSSKSYNCHSYAWIYSVPSNNWWINNPDFFAGSASFTKIGTNCATQTKDKIIIDASNRSSDGFGYTTYALHSLKVTSGGGSSDNILTESKLGQYGVYRASLSDMMSFYGGASYRVYREK